MIFGKLLGPTYLELFEEVILDTPKLAKGHSYFQIVSVSMSNNHLYVAYTIDQNGSERFTLFIKDPIEPPPHYERGRKCRMVCKR